MSDFNYFYGIDLAKLSFSIHGEDRHGKPLVHKSVTRTKLLKEMANLPAGLVELEACSAVHYWEREMKKLGHEEADNGLLYVARALIHDCYEHLLVLEQCFAMLGLLVFIPSVVNTCIVNPGQ